MLLRYDRRKSPTPSYLSCIFTLAARGVYMDLHREYANEQDTPSHERTCVRYAVYVRRFSGVKINHQKDGTAHARYGRRNSHRILRRLRKSTSKAGSICDGILSMRRTNGPHLHGVTIHYHTTRHLPAYFELGGVTPGHLHYAAVT